MIAQMFVSVHLIVACNVITQLQHIHYDTLHNPGPSPSHLVK